MDLTACNELSHWKKNEIEKNEKCLFSNTQEFLHNNFHNKF